MSGNLRSVVLAILRQSVVLSGIESIIHAFEKQGCEASQPDCRPRDPGLNSGFMTQTGQVLVEVPALFDRDIRQEDPAAVLVFSYQAMLTQPDLIGITDREDERQDREFKCQPGGFIGHHRFEPKIIPRNIESKPGNHPSQGLSRLRFPETPTQATMDIDCEESTGLDVQVRMFLVEGLHGMGIRFAVYPDAEKKHFVRELHQR